MRRKYKYKDFESNPTILENGVNDYTANICASMLLSKAWRELTHRQKELYLYCKLQYYGEKKNKDELLTFEEKAQNINVDKSKRFTMNKSKWDKIYHLYNESNQRCFYSDMRALIEKGFVKLIESNKNTRKKNIYEFSSGWKNI